MRNRENNQSCDNVETVEYSQAHHQVVEVFLIKSSSKFLRRLGKDNRPFLQIISNSNFASNILKIFLDFFHWKRKDTKNIADETNAECGWLKSK